MQAMLKKRTTVNLGGRRDGERGACALLHNAQAPRRFILVFLER